MPFSKLIIWKSQTVDLVITVNNIMHFTSALELKFRIANLVSDGVENNNRIIWTLTSIQYITYIQQSPKAYRGYQHLVKMIFYNLIIIKYSHWWLGNVDRKKQIWLDFEICKEITSTAVNAIPLFNQLQATFLTGNSG